MPVSNYFYIESDDFTGHAKFITIEQLKTDKSWYES